MHAIKLLYSLDGTLLNCDGIILFYLPVVSKLKSILVDKARHEMKTEKTIFYKQEIILHKPHLVSMNVAHCIMYTHFQGVGHICLNLNFGQIFPKGLQIQIKNSKMPNILCEKIF